MTTTIVASHGLAGPCHAGCARGGLCIKLRVPERQRPMDSNAQGRWRTLFIGVLIEEERKQAHSVCGGSLTTQDTYRYNRTHALLRYSRQELTHQPLITELGYTEPAGSRSLTAGTQRHTWSTTTKGPHPAAECGRVPFRDSASLLLGRLAGRALAAVFSA